MGSNALIAYNTTNATDATNATTITIEGQMQETGSQNLMIIRQLELKMKKNQLENSRVLKPISGNVVIRKVKTKTSHDGKERSTNMTSLKMIVKQGIDKKL